MAPWLQGTKLHVLRIVPNRTELSSRSDPLYLNQRNDASEVGDCSAESGQWSHWTSTCRAAHATMARPKTLCPRRRFFSLGQPLSAARLTQTAVLEPEHPVAERGEGGVVGRNKDRQLVLAN